MVVNGWFQTGSFRAPREDMLVRSEHRNRTIPGK